jgi:uncharacterized protein (TIGR00255 family)
VFICVHLWFLNPGAAMRSMTGFGQAAWQGQGQRISVEIRSVNQRFLDVRFNLPREYQAWEAELRKLVLAAVERGKIDVNVSRSGATARDVTVEVNEALAGALITSLRRLQRRLGLSGQIDVSLLLSRPELVRVSESRPDSGADLSRVRRLLVAALRRFNEAREREGRALKADMQARLRHLRRIERTLLKRTDALLPELSRRLNERMAALLGDVAVDQARLLQEAALLAERADVTEELVRLRSHLDRLQELMRQRGAAGKAADFLLQEIHREVNTIASKSADVEVTALTLEARGEIEKLREQAQNVE